MFEPSILNELQFYTDLESSPDIYETEIDARELWLAVLEQAKLDLYKHKPTKLREVYHWFLSSNNEIGSFIWICKNFNLSREYIIKQYRDRLALIFQYPNGRQRKGHSELQLELLNRA